MTRLSAASRSRLLALRSIVRVTAWLGMVVSCPTYCQSSIERSHNAVVHSFDGESKEVRIRSLSSETIICESQTIPTTEVYRLDLKSAKILVPDRPADVIAQLVNGDELHLRRVSSTDETLTGTLSGQIVAVPLEYIRAMIFLDGTNRSERHVAAAFSDDPETEDVVALKSRDRLTGEFLSLEKKVLRIDAAGTERTLPLDRIAFLRFNSQLLSPISKADVRAIVELAGGSVLTARRVTTDAAGEIQLRTDWGSTVTTEWRRVRSVRFVNKRTKRLTSLTPEKSSHRPFAGRKRTHRIDKTVNGDNAVHAGRRYFSCVGVTSGMSLTWKLDGGWQSFQSRFGLDDSAPKGAAIFVVSVDGKERFRSSVMKSGQPVGFSGLIDLTGSKSLTLSVEYGPRGDVQDVASWLDPILLRK